MRSRTFFSTTLFSVLVCFSNPLSARAINESAPANDHVFMDMVEKQTFQYFLNEYHPETGLINDQAQNKGRPPRETRASIAATGFGINAFIIGAERGWISKEESYERILTTLKFFYEHAEHDHGFFYHFLEGRKGENVYDSELSSIDTALLLAGMLTAAQYFLDTEVADLAEKIYRRIDFQWMMNDSPFLSMGRNKRRGFLSTYWNSFNESLILYVLAIGSPTHSISPSTWKRVKKNVVQREGETFVFSGPLFIHQYPQVWLDLQGKNDGVADYFENSRRATVANRRFSEERASQYKTYKAGYWGLSASDGPYGYKAYGAADDASHDGTVSPVVAGASIVFTPEIAIEQLRKIYNELNSKMWGRYGFNDAMNLDVNWYSEIVLGIDAGALLSMIENYRTGLIWKLFQQNEAIRTGISRAGFKEGTKNPVIPPPPRYTTTHTESDIAVDAALEEWREVSKIHLIPENHLDYGTLQRVDDIEAEIGFLWNENYLYLAAEITDDEVVSKRTIRYSYRDDLLELFFDLDNDGFSWNNARDPQLGFSFDPKTKAPRLFDWGKGEEIQIKKDVSVAMKITPAGYSIEARIPWSLLGVTPHNPLELRSTPAVHDLDGVQDEAKLSWFFQDNQGKSGILLGKMTLEK